MRGIVWSAAAQTDILLLAIGFNSDSTSPQPQRAKSAIRDDGTEVVMTALLESSG